MRITCMCCMISCLWNVFTLTMWYYLCTNIQINCFLMCLIFFSKLANVHKYNTRNASTQHVYVCFQRTTRGQKTLSYCGARIWNYVLDNVDSNCAIGLFKNVSKDCSCFQTMTYLHDSATYWCIDASVVIMLNLYKDVYTCICMCMCVLLEVHIWHTCAWKEEHWIKRVPALCTVSALHYKNNLFGIVDIGAHKPWWLHVPFGRFYMFHI